MYPPVAGPSAPARETMPKTKPRTAAPAPPVVLDLERYVPALLVFLANKLSGGASALYRRHFGVGTTEWRIMALLAIEPWITANRVCKVIGFDKAAVSRAAAVLTRKGLVAQRPRRADSRSVELSLTPAGWRLHDRVIGVALERERRLLSVLTPAETEALIGLLNRLHAGLPGVEGPVEIPPERR